MITNRNQLVLFDEVDVATQVEREVAGQKQNITFIIRAANTKTFQEIHHEIRTAQVAAVEKAWEGFNAMQWVGFVPPLLSRFVWWFFWWLLGTYPHMQKQYGGTVGISAIGMFGKGGSWGIPINAHTLDITLVGMNEKPGVVDGRIEVREYLGLTISLNHDIIDGAPAARFATRLKELIERGFGLIDQDMETVNAP